MAGRRRRQPPITSCVRWSIPRGYRSDNPCKHVRKLKGGEGYEPWSWEHILHFREHVSKPELWWAAALALYSGQRQSDDIGMLWSDVSDGLMSVVQEKTEKKLRIAIHRDLHGVLAEVPRRATAILSNTRGCPWTGDGFRTSWGKELDRDVMSPLREAETRLSRPEKIGCGPSARSRMHGRGSFGNHRPIASDGRALCAPG